MRRVNRKPRSLSPRSARRVSARARLRDILDPVPTAPFCDFCKAQPCVACFVTSDLKAMHIQRGNEQTTIVDNAHWTACGHCAELIRLGRKQELAAYSYTNGPEDHRVLGSRELRAKVHEGLFWSVFKGREHPIYDHRTYVLTSPGRGGAGSGDA